MRIIDFIISGFYIGYIKFAPGTISSLLFLIIYFFIPNIYLYQISLLIFLLISGFYLCFIFSENSIVKDPPYIVIDEITGMYISIFMLPKSIFLYSIAFVLFRFFDIYKPSIINKSQNLNYGIGIMLDDIISGIFTLVICWSIYLW
tara:strand:+ start:805 stop:1242 length:438 start_codon:yes stop_codon:yes gene_type:complete